MRHVEVKGDQIVTVRTALGIATIIQVPDHPTSVVVGDQGSFKVEYLDQAITIKPLHGTAKSNLYIYTDARRFNVQLIAGAEGAADYVVYLEHPKVKMNQDIKWSTTHRSLSNDGLTLATKRIGKTRSGVLLVEFEIRGRKSEPIRPEWLWLTQNGRMRPIQSLFLSSLEIKPTNLVHGTMQILCSDLDQSEPVRLELRRRKTSFLTLPKVNTWK